MLIGCTQENGGSDDVPNSSKENETKFTTLQEVVDNAAAGDTINLADYTALKDYNATVDRALTITNGSLKNAELTVTNENVKLDRLADLSVKSSSKLTINDSKLNELLLGTNAVSRSAPAVSQVMAMVSVTKCEITKVEMLGFNSQLNITDTFTKITNITTSTKCKVVLEQGSYIDMKAPEVTGSGELVRIDMTKGMELSVLSIYSNPDKVEYNVGETFDKSGLIVMGTYFTSVEIFKNGWNGESKESVTKWEDEKDYKIGDIDLTSGGVKIVEIVSNVNKNIKCYFHIFVKSADSKPETIEISDIRVIQGKIEYKVGEMLDLSGFRVVGKYGDFEINLPYTSDPANGTVLGVDEKTITFYYNSNKIGEVTISVTKDDEPEKCTLTYNANGGSGEMKSTTGDEGSEITLAANTFTKNGYTFAGWNTTADGKGEKFADKEKIKLTANITLYAQWTANTYTVKFDKNGGTGNAPANISTAYDKEFELPENTFTKIGYNFAGWNTKADDSGTDYAAKSDVKNLTAENGATVTLYAKWVEKNKVADVIFSPTGGEIDSGDTVRLSCATEGATIYYVIADNLQSATTNILSNKLEYTSPITITDDTTIAAVAVKNGMIQSDMITATFTVKTYTVTFNANGHGTAPEEITGSKKGSKLSEQQLQGLTATGYTFDGWYKEETKFTADTEITADITLTAKWTANTYTVKFDKNADDVTGEAPAEIQATYDVEFALSANTFTEIGYNFAGWNTKADGSGKDYEAKANVKNLTAENGATVTLYAKWEAIEYKITYENTENATNDNSENYTIETETITLKAPTKDGYTFDGWYTDNSFTEKSKVTEIKKGSIGEMALYAKWLVADKFIKVQGISITGTETWTPESKVFVSGRKLEIKAFYMCDHEVTQAEWKAVMKTTPSPSDMAPTDGNADNNPVNYVSWYDAIVYCNRRSIQEGLTPCYNKSDSTVPNDWGNVPKFGDYDTWKESVTCDFAANGYRLPTEAEWEWAARGGENYTYAGSDDIDEVAWYSVNTDKKGTREVKTKKPNGYGLYDMSGNVQEWCWDWYSNSITDNTPAAGASSGSDRVFHSSAWYHNNNDCGVAYRNGNTPSLQSRVSGFRVVKTAE